MSFFLNFKPQIKPQGNLESDDVTSALYELDQDLTALSEQVANATAGNTVVQATEPSTKTVMWVDTSV